MINKKTIIILVRKYNSKDKAEFKNITINGIHLFNIDKLGVNGKKLLLKRYIGGTLFITGYIDIEDIHIILFDNNKSVALDNLEF